MKRIFSIVILSLMFIAAVHAVPVTGPATLVGTNNATLNAAGAVTTCWFKYGQSATAPGFVTANKSPDAGVCTETIRGVPLVNGVFYYTACDVTGCDATPESFTILEPTPLPTTTLGSGFDNLSQSQFNVLYFPINMALPYTWLLPISVGLNIVIALLFSFIFLGLWWKGKGVGTPVMLGLFFISFVVQGGGLGIAIPQIFLDVAEGLVYASLAGVILSLIKR